MTRIRAQLGSRRRVRTSDERGEMLAGAVGGGRPAKVRLEGMRPVDDVRDATILMHPSKSIESSSTVYVAITGKPECW